MMYDTLFYTKAKITPKSMKNIALLFVFCYNIMKVIFQGWSF